MNPVRRQHSADVSSQHAAEFPSKRIALTRPLTAVSYILSMFSSRKVFASAAYFLKPAPGNHEGRWTRLGIASTGKRPGTEIASPTAFICSSRS